MDIDPAAVAQAVQARTELKAVDRARAALEAEIEALVSQLGDVGMSGPLTDSE